MRINLRQAATGNKRIVGGNRDTAVPGPAAIHINAHHLAQQHLRILAMAERIAFAAAVAQSKIKKSIWTESELAGFVINKVADLIDDQEGYARCTGLPGSDSSPKR